MKRFFLIRHGQASWGKRNYDVLSENGIAQSNILGTYLRQWELNPTKIICGEHERHKDTAIHSLRNMYLEPKFDIDARWNEFDFQNVIEQHKPLYKIHQLMVADLARTLKPRKSFKEMFAEALELWRSGEKDDKYNESWPSFQKRVLSALNSLQEIETEGDTLIYTSGGVIGTITCHLLDTNNEQWAPLVASIINTSITQIVIHEDKMRLLSFNGHGHLIGKHNHLLSQH